MSQKPDVSGLWAVLWRALILSPLLLLCFLAICVAFALLVCLPVLAIDSGLDSEWWQVAAYVAGWLVVWMLCRWWWRRERSDQNKNWGAL